MGRVKLLSGCISAVLALGAAPAFGQTGALTELDEGGKVCFGSQKGNADPAGLPGWINPAMSTMGQTPHEMTFTFKQVGNDRIILATGEIDERAADHLKAAFASYGPINEVHFNSPGGDSDQGEEIGRVIRSHGIVTTRVTRGNGCASACSTAFLGGAMRQIDPGAIYGIHLFSRAIDQNIEMTPDDFKALSAADAALFGKRVEYISSMGISMKWMSLWSATHSDCMTFLSQKQLHDAFVNNMRQ